MFGFLKRKFLVAEVDGIRFYSSSGLQKYLERKESLKRREGKHKFTFLIPEIYASSESNFAKAVNILESMCIEYEVSRNSDNMYVITYWSDSPILKNVNRGGDVKDKED